MEEKRPVPAVILAGGLGLRLRSAYAAGPKSMAPVRGRPFLDYLLSWLQGQGVKEVILCVGYKRSQIQRFVGRGSKWGMRVRYSVEKKLLGTGGALKKAERLISGEPLLVMNGDTFVDVKLGEIMKFHRARKALATLAAVEVVGGSRYGALRVGAGGRVRAFLEKGGKDLKGGSRTRRQLVNGGVYVFEKGLLEKISARGPVSLERKVFPSLLAEKRVYAFESDAYFLDIGVPKDLWRAQRELPERIWNHHSR